MQQVVPKREKFLASSVLQFSIAFSPPPASWTISRHTGFLSPCSQAYSPPIRKTSGHVLTEDPVSFVKELNPKGLIPMHTIRTPTSEFAIRNGMQRGSITSGNSFCSD